MSRRVRERSTRRRAGSRTPSAAWRWWPTPPRARGGRGGGHERTRARGNNGGASRQPDPERRLEMVAHATRRQWETGGAVVAVYQGAGGAGRAGGAGVGGAGGGGG